MHEVVGAKFLFFLICCIFNLANFWNHCSAYLISTVFCFLLKRQNYCFECNSSLSLLIFYFTSSYFGPFLFWSIIALSKFKEESIFILFFVGGGGEYTESLACSLIIIFIISISFFFFSGIIIRNKTGPNKTIIHGDQINLKGRIVTYNEVCIDL